MRAWGGDDNVRGHDGARGHDAEREVQVMLHIKVLGTRIGT